MNDWSQCWEMMQRIRDSVDALQTSLAVSKPVVAGTRNDTAVCDAIKTLVAAKFGLTVENLTSPKRPESIAWPRQIAMYLARECTHMSLQEVGDKFGGKDHGTVLHAVRRVRARMTTERDVCMIVGTLTAEVLSC